MKGIRLLSISLVFQSPTDILYQAKLFKIRVFNFSARKRVRLNKLKHKEARLLSQEM